MKIASICLITCQPIVDPVFILITCVSLFIKIQGYNIDTIFMCVISLMYVLFEYLHMFQILSSSQFIENCTFQNCNRLWSLCIVLNIILIQIKFNTYFWKFIKYFYFIVNYLNIRLTFLPNGFIKCIYVAYISIKW